MKYLYLLRQNEYEEFDTYDSAVICAESEEEACKIHPNGKRWPWTGFTSSWVMTPNQVTIEKLGIALDTLEIGVICSSFNAG